MRDDRIAFLQWALPRLRLRWRGFRRVHGQVDKRIARRHAELGLPDLAAYRRYLEAHADEWHILDELCFVTISRFARDRVVWHTLASDVIPQLAGGGRMRAWSAACGAGEEPYTLAIAWRVVVPGGELDLLATDLHAHQLARAAQATYAEGTLRELPAAWRELAFDRAGDRYVLREPFRQMVRFARHDLRTGAVPGPFDLVLCRNLAFTYFDEALQRDVAQALHAALRPGGFLVVGIHEEAPPPFTPYARAIYRK